MIPIEVRELAAFMHERYEVIAAEEGWVTHNKTRVDFNELPDANRVTMLRLAQEVISRFEETKELK